MSTVTVAEVKSALKKSLSTDDSKIQQHIDAAEAEYTLYVGPISGTVTETLSGGTDRLVLRAPLVTAITAAAYADGSTLAYTDLDLDTTTGIVYWKVNTAGWFTAGTRNVTITYTVAALPANHRETIIADVAGYFEASQRSNSGAAFPGENFDEAPYRTSPMVLFPRIRALAPVRVG